MGGPPSVLLDPDRFRFRAGKGVFDLRLNLLDDLGALTPEWLDPDLFRGMDENLRSDPEMCSEWKRAMAEELLLLAAEGNAVPGGMLEAFGDVCPFNGGPVLRACLGKPVAVGVFPTTGKDSCGIGHVWLIEGLDCRDPLTAEGGEDFKQGLAMATSHPDTTGQSWQLAAHLAQRVLSDSQGAIRGRGELARRWMATGRVEGREIRFVELGRKLDLRTNRSWMIPKENFSPAIAHLKEGKIRALSDVNSAWALISGRGTQKGSERPLPWPAGVQELHILVGEDIKAALASILFTGPQAAVWLWCSESEEKSRQPAKALAAIAKKLGTTAIHLKEMPSSDLVEAERCLRDHFSRMPLDLPVLFNVTSGNRIMSYAVRSEADLHPNMKLIYRDLTHTVPHEFMSFDYSQWPTSVSLISGEKTGGIERLPKESWEMIYTKEKGTGSDALSLAQSYCQLLGLPGVIDEKDCDS